MKQIQISQDGGPEVMKLVDAPKPSPGPEQALVKIAASGVNFIDVYFRSGHYKADLPFTPGNEASGTVEAVGAEVTERQTGRPRGLRDDARLVFGVRAGAGGAAGDAAG